MQTNHMPNRPGRFEMRRTVSVRILVPNRRTRVQNQHKSSTFLAPAPVGLNLSPYVSEFSTLKLKL